MAIVLLTACESTPAAPSSPATSPTSAAEPNKAIGVANDAPGLNEIISLSDNTRAGFEYQFTLWLGDNLKPGFTPALSGVTVEQRIPALKNGSIDFVVYALSITDERKREIGIAGPYLRTRQGVLTRAGSAPVARIEDIFGRSVCTLADSTSEAQLMPLKLQNKIFLTTARGNSACVDRLRRREVDVFSTDKLILSGFANKYKGELAVSSFTFGSSEEYGIGYPLGDLAACESLRQAIRKFVLDNRWHDYFIGNFPDLSSTEAEYKPDINNLDECH